MKNKEKRVYVAPITTLDIIEMEQGIAAQSAIIKTRSNTGTITQTWNDAPDINFEHEW